MSKPTILSLSHRPALDAFTDLKLMQRWETLRRAPAAMSARQFAEAIDTSVADAQHSLDRLLEAGIVVRLRASGARKHIAYRSVASEVFFSWNPDLPAHRAAMRDFHLSIRELSRVILDRHLDLDSGERRPRPYFFGFASVMMTPAEADTVQRLLRAACEVLDEADMRAEARARGTYRGPTAAEEELAYHVAVETRQLARPEPPLPHFELWDERSVPREVARAEQSVEKLLATRELEIARLLAGGKSRPAIAKALGLKPNTVATYCKRIHEKLGVHSRAELTARMKGV
jgi:DNA-binding NarL/FixJ family response regulator